ncbi:septum formation protein Maf [Oribacterium sp. C9]|uniref:Maf family protein n=1 Tax=Oribacterium sp. C9 TaxID=1943579 RepID=UPI0009901F76|nr:Maf family protein [Oribacterium sp. C9]OON86506.1 septum formation protein Maf [Oribacterium sp. C9]
MNIDRFILASGSPRRKELLQQIGITPEIIPSSIEEVVTSTVPEEVVMSLSKQKASDIAEKIAIEEGTSAVILGADTVVSIDGKILGKPHSHEEAADMIRNLQGRTHQVYTGVTVIIVSAEASNKKEQDKDKHPESFGTIVENFSIQTDVHVYPMTESEILAYADSEEPMDKAGAYGIQGSFAKYVKGIDGDYNNVVGLPVAEVYQRIKNYI